MFWRSISPPHLALRAPQVWSDANDLHLVQRSLFYARCDGFSHDGLAFTAPLRFRLESASVERVELVLRKLVQRQESAPVFRPEFGGRRLALC